MDQLTVQVLRRDPKWTERFTTDLQYSSARRRQTSPLLLPRMSRLTADGSDRDLPGALYVFGAAQDNPFHAVNQCLLTDIDEGERRQRPGPAAGRTILKQYGPGKADDRAYESSHRRRIAGTVRVRLHDFIAAIKANPTRSAVALAMSHALPSIWSEIETPDEAEAAPSGS
jgi:hypothetical protein